MCILDRQIDDQEQCTGDMNSRITPSPHGPVFFVDGNSKDSCRRRLRSWQRKQKDLGFKSSGVKSAFFPESKRLQLKSCSEATIFGTWSPRSRRFCHDVVGDPIHGSRASHHRARNAKWRDAPSNRALGARTLRTGLLALLLVTSSY